MQRIFSRRGFRRAEDVVVQKIFLRTCYRAHCVNDWFSGKVQYLFMTNWRGILKIPKIFLSRTNQIIETSLIFLKGVIDWEIRTNIWALFFGFHDFLFETCFYDTYSCLLETNCMQPREVFIYNDITYKKLSQVLKIVFYSWYMMSYLNLIFPVCYAICCVFCCRLLLCNRLVVDRWQSVQKWTWWLVTSIWLNFYHDQWL